MRAIDFDEPGEPEILRLREYPDPRPGPGEVLIEVAAAGVNRADILQRQGHYPAPAGASRILGLEVAGTIAGLGEGVTGYTSGQRVCALLAGGGYAEAACVDARHLIPVPEGLRLVEAAALPEALCTVYYNLVMHARLSEGERLLVHGGASGIGTMAIQVARELGATVACTAGSDEKLAFCESLGADLLIDYNKEDFVEVVRSAGGADVILDIIGAAYLTRNVKALAAGGRIVIIGLQGGRKGELDLAHLLARQARIIGTTLRGLDAELKGRIVQGVRDSLVPLIETGRIKPVLDRAVPIGSAALAHRMIERGEVTGKIVLTLAESETSAGGEIRRAESGPEE